MRGGAPLNSRARHVAQIWPSWKLQPIWSRRSGGGYCAGFIELDPISRVSLVTQLICRLYWLGVRV
jgi:hypothetical protein